MTAVAAPELEWPTASRTQPSPFVQASFALLAVVVVVCVWWPDVPVGRDLPLHLAQIAQLQQWWDGQLPAKYEVNWATPYLLGYGLVFLLAQVVPLVVALKIVLTIAYLALPFALALYLHLTQRDPWLSLLGFPAIFTVGYHLGFLNFMVAVPLVIIGWLVVERIRDQHEQTQRPVLVWALLPLSAFMFYAHAVTWGLFGLVALVLLVDPTSLRRTLIRWLPLAISTGFAFAWVWRTTSQYKDVSDQGEWPLFQDLATLAIDRLVIRFGIMLALVGLFVMIMREHLSRWRDNWRWVTSSLIVLTACLCAPTQIFGTAMILNRLPVVLPVVLALAIRPNARLSRFQATVVASICGAMVLVHLGHALILAEDLANARGIPQHLPDHSRLVYLPQDQSFDLTWFQGAFLHYDGMLQANQPTVEVAFESAYWWPQIIRLRLAEREKIASKLFFFDVSRGDPRIVGRHHVAGHFDYALIRGTSEQVERCLATVRGTSVYRRGNWCLAKLEPLKGDETLWAFPERHAHARENPTD